MFYVLFGAALIKPKTLKYWLLSKEQWVRKKPTQHTPPRATLRALFTPSYHTRL